MDDDRLKEIELKLRDNALHRRKAALDELAAIPAEVAVPILQQLYQNRDFALRRFAVMGLGNHVTDDSWRILNDLLSQEEDANVLAEAANSLFEFGDRAVAPLRELFIRSEHWLVRQTIIAILVESDNFDTFLEVAKLALADENPTTKEAAILALGQLLTTERRQEAFDLLADLAEDDDWRTRWRTAIALSISEDLQAKQLLAKLQQDDHYRVVAAALESK